VRLFFIAGFILLVGCMSTVPSDSYRPRGSTENAWAISGQFNELTGNLIVTIDGRQVINGNVSVWDGSGELYGRYQGRRVSVSCNYVTKVFTAYEQCMVFVDGERAASFQFLY
jgi:hypothetical protein